MRLAVVTKYINQGEQTFIQARFFPVQSKWSLFNDLISFSFSWPWSYCLVIVVKIIQAFKWRIVPWVIMKATQPERRTFCYRHWWAAGPSLEIKYIYISKNSCFKIVPLSHFPPVLLVTWTKIWKKLICKCGSARLSSGDLVSVVLEGSKY